MASELKGITGCHVHHDGSMNVQSNKAAMLAVTNAAAPLDSGPDTVSQGSAVDIHMEKNFLKTKAHHRGSREAISKVKNFIKKPFKAKHKTKPCHCQHRGSSPAEPHTTTVQSLNVSAPCSSTNSIKPDDESFTTKPEARSFAAHMKKAAKKVGPAVLALTIGIAEHYLNNAGF